MQCLPLSGRSSVDQQGHQQSHRPSGGGITPAWQQHLNRPLLRSAGMQLPEVATAANLLALCARSATAVPLQSCISQQSAVAADTLSVLTQEVARLVWHTLVVDPGEEVDVTSPMGNSPRPELLFNSPLKVQYSRSGSSAALAPQGLMRVCVACWDGKAFRGASCHLGGTTCGGCDGCVGRMFCCPVCHRQFEKRWCYEAGSARGSIGRSPLKFRVHRFTHAMEEAAKAIDGAGGWDSGGVDSRGGPDLSTAAVRSAVVVTYLGSRYCAACALSLDHKSKVCGSVLHAHRDRAGGANTQEPTVNHTITVGATRILSMEQRLLEVGGLPVLQTQKLDGQLVTNPGNPAADSCQFTLAHGTQFMLQPGDEELLPRDVGDGRVALGCFLHSMVKPVAESEVSAGIVFRVVHGSAEVDVSSNQVLLDPERCRQLHAKPLPKGGNHAPSWSIGPHSPHVLRRHPVGNRAQVLSAVRTWWQSVADSYAAAVEQPLRRALLGWPGCSMLGLAMPRRENENVEAGSTEVGDTYEASRVDASRVG